MTGAGLLAVGVLGVALERAGRRTLAAGAAGLALALAAGVEHQTPRALLPAPEEVLALLAAAQAARAALGRAGSVAPGLWVCASLWGAVHSSSLWEWWLWWELGALGLTEERKINQNLSSLYSSICFLTSFVSFEIGSSPTRVCTLFSLGLVLRVRTLPATPLALAAGPVWAIGMLRAAELPVPLPQLPGPAVAGVLVLAGLAAWTRPPLLGLARWNVAAALAACTAGASGAAFGLWACAWAPAGYALALGAGPGAGVVLLLAGVGLLPGPALAWALEVRSWSAHPAWPALGAALLGTLPWAAWPGLRALRAPRAEGGDRALVVLALVALLLGWLEVGRRL